MNIRQVIAKVDTLQAEARVYEFLIEHLDTLQPHDDGSLPMFARQDALLIKAAEESEVTEAVYAVLTARMKEISETIESLLSSKVEE